MTNNIRFTASVFHFIQGAQFFRIPFQLGLNFGPFKTLVAAHVFFKAGSQCFDQFFRLFF